MPVGGGSNLIVSDRPRTVAVSTSAFDLVEANGRKIYAGAGARLLEIMRTAEKTDCRASNSGRAYLQRSAAQ